MEKGVGDEMGSVAEFVTFAATSHSSSTCAHADYKATWKREFKLPWCKAGLLKSSR